MKLIANIVLCILLALCTSCKTDPAHDTQQQTQQTTKAKKAPKQAKAANPKKKAETKLKHEMRRSANNNAKDPLLILLHGLGSYEGDMAKLAENLNGKYHIASLRAPIQMAKENRYSWYAYGPKVDKNKANAQMDKSSKLITQTINQLKKQYRLNPEKVLIGGFSQGGIMSYHTALTNPEMFSGVLPMSGRMTEYTQSKISSDVSYKTLDFHITHGTDDPVILYSEGQKAFHLLRSKGIQAKFSPYRGGHNISKKCYEAINGQLGSW